MIGGRAFARVRFDLLAAATAIVIAIMSFLPPSRIEGITTPNMINHLLAYGLLALTGSLDRRSRRALCVAALLFMAYGTVIEIIQPSFGRDFELRDLVANGLGVLAGTVLAALLRRVLWAAGKQAQMER